MDVLDFSAHPIAVLVLLLIAGVLWLLRRALHRAWRGAERPTAAPSADTERRCAECGGTPATMGGPILHDPSCRTLGEVIPVTRTAARAAAPLAMLLGVGLVLAPACQSFGPLGEMARRIYDAASDLEERAPDEPTKKRARGCGKAARDATIAADAAAQAAKDGAPGASALKDAAKEAEKKMHAACRPLHLDVSAAAPDLAAPPRPADMSPPAPPAPDLPAAPAPRPPAPPDMAPRPAAVDGGH